jgi:phospholipase/carboxylesterase
MSPEPVIAVLVLAFQGFEAALRRLNPLVLAEIRKELFVHIEPLQSSQRYLQIAGEDGMDESTRLALLRACDFMLQAIRSFGDAEDLQAAFIAALRAARKYYRAQEAIFALCGVFPEVNRYFLEPGISFSFPAKPSSARQTGLFHVGTDPNIHARGGYSLYVPEFCSPVPDRAFPLIVALHGGYSHGRDFIWAWIREARSRGFVLLAPTSQAMTWSIANVEHDGKLLDRHLKDIFSRIRIDRSRILFAGMSDGGTFALELAFSGTIPCDTVAPVACALPPVNLQNAKRKRIFWVHGAQDWIFPAGRAVQACRLLQQAGVDVKLKMIEDLSHTYPREANDAILKWFSIEKREGTSPP